MKNSCEVMLAAPPSPLYPVAALLQLLASITSGQICNLTVQTIKGAPLHSAELLAHVTMLRINLICLHINPTATLINGAPEYHVCKTGGNKTAFKATVCTDCCLANSHLALTLLALT